MKKSVVALTVAAALSSYAAVVTTTWVDFGTVGPDSYANGTAVEAGATYRLLYLPKGGTLAEATECKRAEAVALAGGGAHCPLTTFQYPLGSSQYAGGSFVTVLGDDSVKSVTIIASTAGASGAAAGSSLTAEAAGPVTLAADATAPRIESVAVKGDRVELTVSGLCVGTYAIETGALGGSWAPTGYGFANCVKGAPSVTVVMPKPEGEAAFYRVTAK